MLTYGTNIDGYTVVGRLADAELTVTWEVEAAGRLYALQVLRNTQGELPERLRRAARALQPLRHPNVVAVLDVLEVNGGPAVLTELVDGTTLERWIADGPQDLQLITTLFRQILEGIGAAHQIGVLHRNLKPSKILVGLDADGRPQARISDFLLAKVREASRSGPVLTLAGTTFGTPEYMAPEQFQGAAGVDERADLFACGCILYEMLTGQRAYTGGNLMEVYTQVSRGVYRPVHSLRPDVPSWMEEVLASLLVPDRAMRARSANAVLARLPALEEASPALVLRVEPPSASFALEEPMEEPPPAEVVVANTPAIEPVEGEVPAPERNPTVVPPPPEVMPDPDPSPPTAVVEVIPTVVPAAPERTHPTFGAEGDEFDLLAEAPTEPDGVRILPREEVEPPFPLYPDLDVVDNDWVDVPDAFPLYGDLQVEDADLFEPADVLAKEAEPTVPMPSDPVVEPIFEPTAEPSFEPAPVSAPAADPAPEPEPEPAPAPAPEPPPAPVMQPPPVVAEVTPGRTTRTPTYESIEDFDWADISGIDPDAEPSFELPAGGFAQVVPLHAAPDVPVHPSPAPPLPPPPPPVVDLEPTETFPTEDEPAPVVWADEETPAPVGLAPVRSEPGTLPRLSEAEVLRDAPEEDEPPVAPPVAVRPAVVHRPGPPAPPEFALPVDTITPGDAAQRAAKGALPAWESPAGTEEHDEHGTDARRSVEPEDALSTAHRLSPQVIVAVAMLVGAASGALLLLGATQLLLFIVRHG